MTLRSALLAAACCGVVACDPVLEGPPPSLADPTPGELPVEPPILCREQQPAEGTAVTVHGDSFAPIPFDIPNDPKVALPDLTLLGAHDLLGGEAELGDVAFEGTPGGVNSDLLSWQSQQQLTFIFLDELALGDGQGAVPAGLYDVAVENADGQAAISALAFAVTERPSVVTLEPPLLCVEQGPRTLVVNAGNVLRIGDELPAVGVGALELVPTLGDCSDVAHPGIDAELCSTVTVELAQGSFAPGVHRVSITNPAPATCTSAGDVVDVTVVPPPTIDSIEPTGACSDIPGAVDLTVVGTGFLRVDGTEFDVTVAGITVAPSAVGGCTDVTVAGLTVESCTTFVVSIDAGALPAGAVEVAVENPPPAGCNAATSDLFAIVPAPTITDVTPAGQCTLAGGPTSITVSGVGFLRADGVDFTVTFNGLSVSPTSITGCGAVAMPGVDLQQCSGFTINVDTTSLAMGSVPIVVDNPDVRDCAGSATGAFEMLGPPTITALQPDELCSDVATTFDIIGTGLSSASTVTVGGVAPDTVVANGAGTALTVTFTDGLPAGTYDVAVSNGAGCDATAIAALTVHPTPLVFFVDPPIVFNGITLQTTVFASGIDVTGADSVQLIDAGGTTTSLVVTNPGRRSRVLADMPAGLAPGDYAVHVTSAEGCPSTLDGSVTVTDQITSSIASVDPSFVSPTVPTAITITAANQLTFENLPRVYLSPATGGGDAIALRAVELASSTQISAVVSGAVSGVYDLIIVNPSGTVGFLADAVTVTVAEPPLITSVAPGSLNAGQTSTVVIGGANFDAAAPVVTLDCVAFADGSDVPDGAVAVVTPSATSITASVNANTIPAGAVCVVQVQNPDGARYRFSALSFRNPAQNLNSFRAGRPMLEARRALALAAGRPTDTSRLLYAVGGDDGTRAGTKTTVEGVSVDPFGAMGTWTAQRNTLANAFDGSQTTALPRAFAGVARIGRFLYLVGGDGSAGPTATLLRAQVLDPLQGPEITDLDATLGDGTVGLAAGLYLYRVSALFPTTDASNPGGESLAGELFNVELPAVPELLALTLSWAAVPGASGYRLYRTPSPDLGAGALELLVELAGGASTNYVDDGTGTSNPAVTPMPQGSLGVWHALPGAALGTPRAAQATLAVPTGTPGSFFLYAVGGRTTGDTVIGTGEVTTITVAGNGSQTVAAWAPLTASVSPARQQLVAFSISPADTPTAGTDTFLFFGAGRRGNGQVDNTVEAAARSGTGNITTFTNVSGPNPARVGAAGLGANGFLFYFGGANGSASNNDLSTELLDASPTLDNWNGLGGGGMLTPRIYLSAALESAFIFVGGGVDNTATPLASIEQTVQ